MRKELLEIFHKLGTKGLANLISRNHTLSIDNVKEPKDAMNWEYIQANSNYILLEGLNKLKEETYYEFGGEFTKDGGNYVISYEGNPLYIGETNNIDKRLKDHHKGDTFYKNYKEKSSTLKLPPDLTMDHFRHQNLSVSFGRKDLEEFGMVNLPTPLNKFQKDKRELFSTESSTSAWNNIQGMASELLNQGEKKVLSYQPTLWNQTIAQAVPGVYVILDPKDQLIYIGETSSLAERYTTHSGKTRFSAFRRQLATVIFSFKLKTKSELGFNPTDKKRGFITKREDQELNEYISRCRLIAIPVYCGRLELEEQMIKNNRPLLNRKGNK